MRTFCAFLAIAVIGACAHATQHRASSITAQASTARDTLPSCEGGFGKGSCEDGPRTCKINSPGFGGQTVEFSDEGRSIRSDGRGPYLSTQSGVRVTAAQVGGLFLGPRTSANPPRSILVDLSHPVPRDISVPLGVISEDGIWKGPLPKGADYFTEVVAQWKTDPDGTVHTMYEIPINSTVKADQIDLDVHINGVHHLLQFGPQPTGHCFAGGTAIFGDGTTQGTITRSSQSRWVIDLPQGSIGRLFDDSRFSDKYAVNRGRYYLSMHVVLTARTPVELALLPIAEQGTADQVIRRYRELRQSTSPDWAFDEGGLNTVGYWLLEHKRPADAVAVFRLNVQEYPAAPNPYDSLGEAYLVVGDTANAVANYRRSLVLNARNTNAAEVLKRLGVSP